MSSKQEPETMIKSIGKQNGWLFLPEPRYDPQGTRTSPAARPPGQYAGPDGRWHPDILDIS
jgi:hypothetical protein